MNNLQVRGNGHLGYRIYWLVILNRFFMRVYSIVPFLLVIYIHFASWKLREAGESGMEEALRYILQFYGRLDQSLKTIFESAQSNPETDSIINKFTLFIDLEELSLYQLASTKSMCQF